MDKKDFTDFLFSKTGFTIGLGSVYNIPGNFYDFNYSKNETEADNKAIRMDWSMIASDLSQAIKSEENLKRENR